jgi:hypothetical protein
VIVASVSVASRRARARTALPRGASARAARIQTRALRAALPPHAAHAGRVGRLCNGRPLSVHATASESAAAPARVTPVEHEPRARRRRHAQWEWSLWYSWKWSVTLERHRRRSHRLEVGHVLLDLALELGVLHHGLRVRKVQGEVQVQHRVQPFLMWGTTVMSIFWSLCYMLYWNTFER